MLINRHGWAARSVAIGASMMLLLPTVSALHAAEPAPEPEVEVEAPAADADAADAPAADADAAMAVADQLDQEPAYTDEELQALAAPIALYPDALLIQVLMASTFPLDLVRAERWMRDNPDVPPEDILDGVEQQDWDPSIISLTAFPTVLTKMAEDLDWTEKLGDAMLLQSDDLLDAVQVLRAQAQAAGALESNEYQTVSYEEEQTIAIAPTDPEVVYVPQYEPEKVYVAQPATTTVVTTSGHSDGAMVATGVMAFTAGVIVANIFNNNDRRDYYWGPSYRRVSWHSHRVYPPYYRPGGSYRPPHYRPPPPGYRPGNGWRPRPEQHRAARDRMNHGRDLNAKDHRNKKRDVNLNDRSRPGAKDRARPNATDRSKDLNRKLKDRGRDKPGASRPDKPQRPAAGTRDRTRDRTKPAARPGKNDSAFGDRASQPKVRKDRDRGAKSRDRAKKPDDRGAARPKSRDNPKVAKQDRRPKAKAAPKKRDTPRGGAFNKTSGSKASAQKKRGKASAGNKKRAKAGGNKKRAKSGGRDKKR